MDILIVAATEMELQPLRQKLASSTLPPQLSVDFLAGGIGVTATAYTLTKALQNKRYGLAINIGIAGSFTSMFKLGEVCLVFSEQFADLGIQTEQGFNTLFEEGLLAENTSPFTKGELICRHVEEYKALAPLTKAKGVTVSTVSGSQEKVKLLSAKFKPDVESMEGAAFFYVCLQEGVPFIELRSISNMVGVRDKRLWNIPLALDNLATKAVEVLQQFSGI